MMMIDIIFHSLLQLLILPTHTNNSRHFYSIIFRFVGECEGGIIAMQVGGDYFLLVLLCVFLRYGG